MRVKGMKGLRGIKDLKGWHFSGHPTFRLSDILRKFRNDGFARLAMTAVSTAIMLDQKARAVISRLLGNFFSPELERDESTFGAFFTVMVRNVFFYLCITGFFVQPHVVIH